MGADGELRFITYKYIANLGQDFSVALFLLNDCRIPMGDGGQHCPVFTHVVRAELGGPRPDGSWTTRRCSALPVPAFVRRKLRGPLGTLFVKVRDLPLREQRPSRQLPDRRAMP